MSVDPSRRIPNLSTHHVNDAKSSQKKESSKSVRLPFFNPKESPGVSLKGRASRAQSDKTAAVARSNFSLNNLRGRVNENPGKIVSINSQFAKVRHDAPTRELHSAKQLPESERAAALRRRIG